MININNIAGISWTETKIGILGGGISGIAAAKLGRYMGADIFISDSNDSPDTIKEMCDFDYESGVHSEKILQDSSKFQIVK